MYPIMDIVKVGVGDAEYLACGDYEWEWLDWGAGDAHVNLEYR